MLRQIVDLNPIEPARIGLRQARGVQFSRRFYFVENSQPYGLANDYPQLVLRPRSRSGANGYDMAVVDAIAGTADVSIPGPTINDPNGFSVEIYFRDPGGQPTRLVAEGQLSYTGLAYQTEGPLGPATYPVGPSGPSGPEGPTGAQGNQGIRGGTWRTGQGDPIRLGGEVNGDMYLNESNGDVWRFDNGQWAQI